MGEPSDHKTLLLTLSNSSSNAKHLPSRIVLDPVFSTGQFRTGLSNEDSGVCFCWSKATFGGWEGGHCLEDGLKYMYR
jgi:hypothetical protein